MIARSVAIAAGVLLPAMALAAGPAIQRGTAALQRPVPMIAGQVVTVDLADMPAHPLLRELGFVLLPLKAAAGSNQQDIADGLTAYLTGDLSRISGSFVIAGASAAALRNGDETPIEIAKQFGVRYAITGLAGADGSKLRIELSLFDSYAGKSSWSGSFGGDAAELAGLRREVVQKIAQATGASLREAAPIPSGRVPGQLLLRARAILNRPQTAATMTEARHLLESALNGEGAVGPAMPEAVTELASIHLAEALSGRSPAPGQDLQRSLQLVEQALAVMPGQGQASALKGALLRILRKPEAALAAYEAAVAADDNLAEAYAEIGRVKIDLGQAAEALPPIERALALSPLDPQRALWLSFAGMAELYAGHPAKAIPFLRDSAALDARFLNPRIWLAAAHELAGQHEAATGDLKEALKLSPDLTARRLAHRLEADNSRISAQASQILSALRQAGLPN